MSLEDKEGFGGAPHKRRDSGSVTEKPLRLCGNIHPLYLSSVLEAEDHAGRVAQPTLSCAKCLSRVPCPSSAWAGGGQLESRPGPFLANELPLDAIRIESETVPHGSRNGRVSTSILISRSRAVHRHPFVPSKQSLAARLFSSSSA
jgi:hypothetical protein